MEARRASYKPFGSAKGTICKTAPAGGFVYEFHALAISRENHGVVAHDIASPHCMYCDRVGFAFPGDTFASKTCDFLEIRASALRN